MRRNSYRPADDVVISLRHVSKQYSKDAPGVIDANLEIHEGEFVFITGETGSGKSTLLKMIMRQLRATEGSIEVLGYDLNRIRHSKISKFRRNIGIVFQDFRLLKDRDVYENVAFAQRILMVPKNQMKHNVTSVLQMVGMADKYKRQVTQLSGGEQQRVALARALVNNPPIIIADEPTGNIDPELSFEILDLLCQINEQCGTTVVMVTHEHELVKYFNKRVIAIEDGKVVGDSHKGAEGSRLFTGNALEDFGEHYEGRDKVVARTIKPEDRGPESNTGIYSFILSEDEMSVRGKE